MQRLKSPATIVLSLAALVAIVNRTLRSERGVEAGGGGGPEIIVYSQPGFQGHELRLSGNVIDLPVVELEDGSSFDWNDNIGSIVVTSGTWRLYQHGRLNTELDATPLAALDLSTRDSARGWSSVISASSRGPLRIAEPRLAGIGFDVSSIQLVASDNLPDWLYLVR